MRVRDAEPSTAGAIPRLTPSPAIAYVPPLAAAALAAHGVPSIAAPALPTHIASLSPLAFASRIVPSFPLKRISAVHVRKLAAALAGGLVALIIVMIVQAVHDAPAANAATSARLAPSKAPALETYRMRTTAKVITATPIEAPTVTPIETPTVTPIEPTVPAAAATKLVKKPIAKRKKSKRSRRIVVSDTSTPLGNLRPRRM